MLILFLIIPPAAIRQPYSPTKFECPDAASLKDRHSAVLPVARRRTKVASRSARPKPARDERAVQMLQAARESSPLDEARLRPIGRRLVLEPDLLTLRCVNCRAVGSAPAALRPVSDPELANAQFTVVAEFII